MALNPDEEPPVSGLGKTKFYWKEVKENKEIEGYTKSEIDDKLTEKANVTHTQQDSSIKVTTQNYGNITQDTFNNYLSYDMLQVKNNKQDKLISGENIKTINNESILGDGNINIQNGGSTNYNDLTDIPSINENPLTGNKTFTDLGLKEELLNLIYPVGSIYMSVNDVSPSVLFGGSWKKIEDTFLLSSGSNYSLGETGGSKDAIVVEHNHTQNAHNHKPSQNSNFVSTNGVNWVFTGGKAAISGSGTYKYAYTSSTDSATISEPATTSDTTATNKPTGESGIDKNMPPYLVVNVWERIQLFLKTCFDADYLNNTYLSYDEDTNTLYCPSVHEYYSTQTFVNYDITSGKTLTVEFTIDNSNTSTSGADRRGVGICSGRNHLSVFRDIRNVLISSTDGSELDTGKNYFTNTYSNVKLELVGTECSIWIDDEFVTSITHTLNGDIGLYINKWQWGRVGVKDFRFSYR